MCDEPNTELNRRTFLAAVGAGATLAVSASAQETPQPPVADASQDIEIRTAVTGTVKCSNSPYNALPSVLVDANGIYDCLTGSNGSYNLSVLANDYYDLTADPTDHGTRTYLEVWVGTTTVTKNFSCSHLPGALLLSID